ncbi:hypothetical protein PQC39_gp028 [Vibrio phage Vp_R1]|uniref:Uncharacterized protein n=1 Tax=Vibrio phage Vp_R1 TaxID=2059867 RepID=A0A2H5BPY0_9CAUD|nr:hypothetical protein PQC39_gp028 [Vibrio phage Vp_R1]AUG88392.1 hypothetical protein VPR_028 [Vibrio phage Vp_R1]
MKDLEIEVVKPEDSIFSKKVIVHGYAGLDESVEFAEFNHKGKKFVNVTVVADNLKATSVALPVKLLEKAIAKVKQ